MKNLPFLLTPATKDYLWGGSRLNDEFNKELDVFPLAETWECSTHPEGQSVIASGKHKGVLLSKTLKEYPEYLGTHPLQITNNAPLLPIIIKLVDANKDLSLQVHPGDDYALKVENSLGKTEMWYVLDAKKDSKIIYGFNQDMSEERLRSVLQEGTINKYLNYVPVNKNDMFYIEAGTVHAIGSGVLIAEIQQSSNVTYRLYDYDRVDKNGKKRPLHIDKAIDVAKLDSSVAPRQPMRVLKYRSGCANELLTRCKYFQVERMLLNTEVHRKLVEYHTVSNSFHVLLVVDGCGCVSGNDFMLNFFKGDCIFVPAESIQMKLHGCAQILDVSC